MAGGRKTSQASLAVGHTSWIQDLSDFANGFEVAGSVNIERSTVLESQGVEADAINGSHNVSIGSLYYGDATAVLQSHQADETKRMAIWTTDGVSYFGPAAYPGLPLSAPSDSLLVHSLDLIQSDEWYACEGITRSHAVRVHKLGNRVKAFDGVLTDALFGVLVITRHDPTSGTYTIQIGASTVRVTPGAASIYAVDLSALTASVTDGNITLSSGSLSGANRIHGALLVGTPFGVD